MKERLPVRGFILGAGAFTLGVRAGQEAHSMGLFDSLAVGMTSAWGVVQGMFGANDNPWRRGVEMTVRLFPGGETLAHSGHGDPYHGHEAHEGENDHVFDDAASFSLFGPGASSLWSVANGSTPPRKAARASAWVAVGLVNRMKSNTKINLAKIKLKPA